MTNDEIIRKHAIEFVNCYWNVEYELPNQGDTCIGTYKQFSLNDKLKYDFADIEEYVHYFDNNLNPLDSIINILNHYIHECCYVLSNYAIDDNDIFHYLDGKIINGLGTDWYNIVKLDYEYQKDDGGYRYTYRANKLFIIGDDNYKEIIKKQKTIEYYEVKNE